MGLSATQGDEKRFLLSNFSLWKRLLSPLSSRPERSAVERSLCGCSFLEVFRLPLLSALRGTLVCCRGRGDCVETRWPDR
jgi:hypothetical protein